MSKLREENPIDYTTMALEGLWWSDSGDFDFSRTEPWRCTLMMLQPDHISEDMYQEAVQKLRQKKPNPLLDDLRFERFREGLCVQMMHVGPYSQEQHTIARMHAFARDNGYKFCGKHHEIYIGDPRLARPENLRTVLRHPVVG